MTLPVIRRPIPAYHGDTTQILGATVVRISDDETAAESTARLHLRNGAGVLLLEVEPEVTESTLGRIEIAPVVLTPSDWADLPRTRTDLPFDMEVTHPELGTRTLVRGSVSVTPDVTYTED
jgi:hypothetical protein